MGISDTVWIALSGAAGGILVKAWEYYRPKKKEVQETGKISIEAMVLSDTEQRAKDKFCEDQLNGLEKKYKILQSEMDALRDILKDVMAKLDETERKYHQALNDITYLKIELAAYKPG